MFASTAITIKHCGKKSGRNIFPALSVRNYQRYTRFGHFHAQRSSERAFVGQQIDDPLRLICRSALLGLPSSLKFSPIDTAYLCFGVRSVSTGRPDNNEAADAGKVGALKNGPSSSMDAKAASSSYSSESEKSSSASHVSRTLSEKKEASGVKKATDTVQWALKSIFSLLAKSPGVMWFYITHPKDFRKKLAELKEAAVKEAHHYWMGSKLLAADVRTARHLMGRTLRGSTLSRRERKQLLRTTTDLFRLVPMSVFVLVPFMEFALPFALKIFPNMLPSTFQDSLKEEEKMKGELQMRISMAGFFQDTLTELAKEQKKFAQIRKYDADDASDAESIEIEKEASAISFLDFLKKARTGEAIPPDVIIKFAKYFEDNLTLDNMGRMQLINMCKYMGIPPYGNDNLLRFQLRHRIRLLKDDDQRILWEGIESLTKMELREACRERGMRSIGLSKVAYRNALQQWLDLSVQKNVPISLLIMSRTFFLHDEMITGESSSIGSGKGVIGLADTMSGIDKEVLNEIVLEMASSEEKSKNTEVMKIQLEVLEHQNEMIKEEQEERDAAAKEKVEKDKSDEKETLMEKSLSSKEIDKSLDGFDPLANPASSPPEVAVLGTVDANSIEQEPKEDEQAELSTAEIDAISQLASADPVLREREELKRIKDKMHGEIGVESDAQIVLIDKSQDEAAIAFKEINDAIEKEAKDILMGDTESKQTIESHDDEPVVDKKLQKAIDRLKSRVESMVGKIETQLSHVEIKIGSKFHLLDKDGDGVLTMEEMAQVLQTVLKRELTAEEAMAIAEDMDHNKDGVFSIAELAQWAETNTIVKLAEDGREKDLNDMISARVADLNEKKKMMKQEARTETPSN